MGTRTAAAALLSASCAVVAIAACAPTCPVPAPCPTGVLVPTPASCPTPSAASASAVPIASAPAPSPPVTLAPALAPYSFLLGDWESPPGPDGTHGGSTFEAGAQGHALVRKNFADAPKGRHEDSMMIFASPQGGVRALYVDNEAHAIDYEVSASDDPKTATFLSAGGGRGPRFRLTYRLQADGSVTGKFEVQLPGAADFKPHLEWTMHRR